MVKVWYVCDQRIELRDTTHQTHQMHVAIEAILTKLFFFFILFFVP